MNRCAITTLKAAAATGIAFTVLLAASGCPQRTSTPTKPTNAALATPPALDSLLPEAEKRRPLARSLRSLAELTRTQSPRIDAGAFEVPNVQRSKRFEACMTLVLSAAMCPETERRPHLERAAAALWDIGFELEESASSPLWVIRERNEQRRGAGLYVVRCAPPARTTSALILQAPHRFFDRETGRIARRLFTATKARMLMLNTAHRYTLRPHSDLAHAERSYFQAATRAAARVFQDACFLQIHGYRADAHPKLTGVDAVLSTGRKRTPPPATLVSSLRTALDPATLCVYGRSTQELGATTNEQGRYLNTHTRARFFHLELEEALRQRLVRNAAALRRLAAAITRVVQRAETAHRNRYRQSFHTKSTPESTRNQALACIVEWRAGRSAEW